MKTKTGGTAALLIAVCYLLFACEQQPPDPGANPGNKTDILAPPAEPPGDAIRIDSGAGLENIGKTTPSDGNYILTADITVENWTPLCSSAAPFTGAFYGANHTITITGGSGGLFASLKGGTTQAMVRDLAVNVTAANPSGGSIGGVAGTAERSLVENCTARVNLTLTGVNYNASAGGIVGFMRDNSTVRSCTATGSVSLRTGPGEGLMVYAGGVAGYSGTGTAGDGSSGCLIERSSWDGEVSAEAGYPYAGGVTGYNYTGAKITECFSAGSVTAKGENLPYAGGIAGYNSGYVRDAIPPTPPVTVSVIENCYSTATVSAESLGRSALAGGISGANAKGAAVSKCYAAGTVTATVDGSGSGNTGGSLGPRLAANAGGIAGAQYYAEFSVNPRIEHCAALNAGIYGLDSSGGGAAWNIYRIAGAGDSGFDNGEWLNNIANPAMTLTTGTQSRTLAAADKSGSTKDGADAAAAPPEASYTGLGWDFDAVWKMGNGGCPALKWEP